MITLIDLKNDIVITFIKKLNYLLACKSKVHTLTLHTFTLHIQTIRIRHNAKHCTTYCESGNVVVCQDSSERDHTCIWIDVEVLFGNIIR